MIESFFLYDADSPPHAGPIPSPYCQWAGSIASSGSTIKPTIRSQRAIYHLRLSVHVDSHIYHLSTSNPTLLCMKVLKNNFNACTLHLNSMTLVLHVKALKSNLRSSAFGPCRFSHSPFVKVECDIVEASSRSTVSLIVVLYKGCFIDLIWMLIHSISIPYTD